RLSKAWRKSAKRTLAPWRQLINGVSVAEMETPPELTCPRYDLTRRETHSRIDIVISEARNLCGNLCERAKSQLMSIYSSLAKSDLSAEEVVDLCFRAYDLLAEGGFPARLFE